MRNLLPDVERIIRSLGEWTTSPTNLNLKLGGLIGLASVAVSLGKVLLLSFLFFIFLIYNSIFS